MPEDTAADGRNGDDADRADGQAAATAPDSVTTNPDGGPADTESTSSEPEDTSAPSTGVDEPVESAPDESSDGSVPDTTDDATGSSADDATGTSTDDAEDERAGAVDGTDDTDDARSAEAEETDVPPDVQQYARFKKVDGSRYERVNDFLRDRTYITAREWAIARLCADFRTETGVEMTKIGENLPELVPFMTDTYTPQAVNQARASFEEKVRMAGATFLYGAMCDFFTAEELDDLIYEVTEVAKFLLEVEGVDLAVEDELETEDRISDVMREVRTASEALRNGPVECPECGHEMSSEEAEE
jgi:hypothetical protein